MTRQLRIRLNLAILINHLAREEGKDVSTDEALNWLRDAGFTQSGKYWVVSQADLGHLDPTEVLEVEPIDDRG